MKSAGSIVQRSAGTTAWRRRRGPWTASSDGTSMREPLLGLHLVDDVVTAQRAACSSEMNWPTATLLTDVQVVGAAQLLAATASWRRWASVRRMTLVIRAGRPLSLTAAHPLFDAAAGRALLDQRPFLRLGAGARRHLTSRMRGGMQDGWASSSGSSLSCPTWPRGRLLQALRTSGARRRAALPGPDPVGAQGAVGATRRGLSRAGHAGLRRRTTPMSAAVLARSSTAALALIEQVLKADTCRGHADPADGLYRRRRGRRIAGSVRTAQPSRPSEVGPNPVPRSSWWRQEGNNEAPLRRSPLSVGSGHPIPP